MMKLTKKQQTIKDTINEHWDCIFSKYEAIEFIQAYIDESATSEDIIIAYNDLKKGK